MLHVLHRRKTLLHSISCSITFEPVPGGAKGISAGIPDSFWVLPLATGEKCDSLLSFSYSLFRYSNHKGRAFCTLDFGWRLRMLWRCCSSRYNNLCFPKQGYVARVIEGDILGVTEDSKVCVLLLYRRVVTKLYQLMKAESMPDLALRQLKVWIWIQAPLSKDLASRSHWIFRTCTGLGKYVKRNG